MPVRPVWLMFLIGINELCVYITSHGLEAKYKHL